MTQGFIQDCATWAKAFNAAASQIEESVIEEEDKQILSYTIRFDSGHIIQAFTSNPRNLRSKGRPGERLVIDEAAFVDGLAELLKAAMAMTIWGGQVRIISTHNGEDNPFNELINDVRAGKLPYSVHRVDLDDALRDGFYRKICAVTGQAWTAEGEAIWRAGIIARYRPNEDEELFCIPAQGRRLADSRTNRGPHGRGPGDSLHGQQGIQPVRPGSAPGADAGMDRHRAETAAQALESRTAPRIGHGLCPLG